MYCTCPKTSEDWKLFSGGLHGIVPVTFPYVPGFDISGKAGEVLGPSYVSLVLFMESCMYICICTCIHKQRAERATPDTYIYIYTYRDIDTLSHMVCTHMHICV